MRTNFIFLFYVLTISAFPQQWQWALSEKVNTIAVDAAGNQLIVQDSILKKLSPQGTVLWQKHFSGDLANIRLSGGEEGNYYLSGTFTGFSFNGQNFLSTGSAEILLAKIDPLGNLAWTRRYGGASANMVNWIHYGRQGGVYICGRLGAGSQLGDTSYDQPGFFILGTDENGQEIMRRKYAGASGWEIGTDSVGDLYVLGGGEDGDSIRFENGLFQRGYFPGFHFMAKYTRNGSLLWAKDFGGNYYAPHRTLAVEAAGTFYLSMWQRYAGFDLSRYDDSGTNLWTRSFADVYGDCSSLLIDQQNTLWITGSMYNCNGQCQRPFLWRVNNSGNTLDSTMETYATRSDGIASDAAQNFYVFGAFDNEEHFGSTTLSGSQQTAYLAKFTISGTTIVKADATLAEVQIYPNPLQDHFIVNLPSSRLPAKLRLYNAQGQCSYSSAITSSESRINVEALSPGPYIVEVEMASEIVRKKVILADK